MKWTTNPNKDFCKKKCGMGHRIVDNRKEGTPAECFERIMKGDWKGRPYVRYNGMDNGGWVCHTSTNHGRGASEFISANNLYIYGTKAEHRELEKLLEPHMKVFPREYQDERIAGHPTPCHECGFCRDDEMWGDFCVMDTHISDYAREKWL